MKEYVGKQGLTFVDFSSDIEKIGLDYTTDLWSGNHFDSLGAEKVTRLFCDFLKSHYSIPNRKNDKEYEEMYTDYIEWKKKKIEYEKSDRSG